MTSDDTRSTPPNGPASPFAPGGPTDAWAATSSGPAPTGTPADTTPMGRSGAATGADGTATRRFGTPPPPPPPAAPRTAPTDGGRSGLPLRSYIAIALTAALGAGAVVVPTQLLDDDRSSAGSVARSADEATPQETAAGPDDGEEASTVEPLPGAAAGSQVAAIAERLTPSVLRIDVDTAGGEGVGSGVVYDTQGHVITNNHVIEDATELSVLTPAGESFDATVVGADPTTDIAVLRVDGDRTLPVPTFADGEPTVGELAVAIGSPFSQDSSVTAGIVSGLGRTLRAPNATLFDLVQTDAAINPGNSGGALINGGGEVIGINTAILSRSGANDGIGFAVPATIATSVADDLIEFGEIRAGYLGVRGLPLTDDVAEEYGVEARAGAIIDAVEPGSPADDAGVLRGDIVVGFDGDEITSMTDLASLVRQREPGETITLTVLRDDERVDLELVLGNRADA